MASDPVKHLALLRTIRDYPMPAQEKAVVLSLCVYGDSDGTSIHPCQRTLAKTNDMTLRGMQMIFRKIRDKKYIVEAGWQNGHRKWRINTELFLTAPPVQVEKPVKPKKEKSKPVVPAPVVETPVKLTFAEQIRREMSNHV